VNGIAGPLAGEVRNENIHVRAAGLLLVVTEQKITRPQDVEHILG
jgi:hypothetical protein